MNLVRELSSYVQKDIRHVILNSGGPRNCVARGQNVQGPQRQNVKSNMPIIVHNTDFLAIKMVLVHY